MPVGNRKQEYRKKRTAKFSSTMKKKLLIVFSAIIALSVGLVARLIYIDQVKGEEYEKQVLGQQSYGSETIPYQRGEILDTKGIVLATNVDVYNVVLDCKLINDDKDKYMEPTIKALLQCFEDVTEEEIRAALAEQADSRYFVLRRSCSMSRLSHFRNCRLRRIERVRR